MTFILASVAKDVAYLSQDGAVSIALPGQIERMNAALAGAGDGNTIAPEPTLLRRSMRKIRIIPFTNYAVGRAGTELPFGLLNLALAFQCPTFDSFEAKVAKRWAILPARVRAMPLVIFAIGWSERRSRMAGIVCNSADSMQPDEVIDAHAFGQEIAAGYPESREAQRLSDMPLELADLPRLHRLAATIATRQSRAGQLGGVAVGGRLQTVQVDRAGGARIVAEADLDALAA